MVAPPSRHNSGGVYEWQNDWRTTALAPVPEWLLQLIRKHDQVKGQPRKAGKGKASLPTWAQAELSSEDRDIINRLEQGLVGNKYQLLVSGGWEGLYPTQSEADLAMFNKLARLVDGDPGRMYAIFKETALMRDGNDKPFSYYQRTILKAINGLNWRPPPGHTRASRRVSGDSWLCPDPATARPGRPRATAQRDGGGPAPAGLTGVGHPPPQLWTV